MYLPRGTLLNDRYEIDSVLGHGGFGITYLARDRTLNVHVAVKEYFPRQLATRAEGATRVSVFTGKSQEHYAYGLKKFLEEARSVAQFADHPNIVSARDYFQANNTAYMVMRYVQGVDFKEYLKQQGGKVSFDLALKIMMPVMDALRAVHSAGLLHRDVSPDNIYLTRDGQVRLMDFGAARQQVGEQEKTLSVILKAGYAPVEQYTSKGKQGPWTDIYAAGATIYRAITGQTPPEALDRVTGDELLPPSRLGAAIPAAAEQALMKAMSLKAAQRYESMAEFQAALEGRGPAPGATLGVPPPRMETAKPSAPAPTPAAPAKKPDRTIPVVFTVVGIILALIILASLGTKPEKGTNASLPPGLTGPSMPTYNDHYYVDQGRKALAMKNYEIARGSFNSALRLNSKNVPAYLGLAEALLELKSFKEALDAASQAMALEPGNHMAYFQAGVALAFQSNLNDAAKNFETAVRLKPDFSEGHFNLALAYALSGRKDAAFKQQEILRNLDAKSAADLLALIRKKFPEKEPVKSAGPQEAQKLLEEGIKYLDAGSNQRAVEALEKALRLEPKNAQIRLNLGRAYFNLGRYQAAVEANQRALGLNPDSFLANHNLGMAYAKLGRYQEAARALEKAVRLKPDYAQAHYSLGAIYCKLGRLDLARSQHAILLNQDAKLASELLALINQGPSKTRAPKKKAAVTTFGISGPPTLTGRNYKGKG
jgi:serine/threonine protein kinase